MCEIACARTHDGLINPEFSRIRVYSYYPGPISIPIVCSYCSDHPCVEACPVKAMYWDKDNWTIKVDEQKCLGVKCAMCAKACEKMRSNAIRFTPTEPRHAMICDQCGGDPQCVKACKFGVLVYIPKILEGRHFADPPRVIAEHIAEQWFPVSYDKRLRLPSVKGA